MVADGHRVFSLLDSAFTILTVMFWSKKSSTATINAGNDASQRYLTGRAPRGTSQGRPDVVEKVAGIASFL